MIEYLGYSSLHTRVQNENSFFTAFIYMRENTNVPCLHVHILFVNQKKVNSKLSTVQYDTYLSLPDTNL